MMVGFENRAIAYDVDQDLITNRCTPTTSRGFKLRSVQLSKVVLFALDGTVKWVGLFITHFCSTTVGWQIGNMEFIRGNRAIRDHIDAGEDLHLFEYVDQGLVRYVSQMLCIGYQRRIAADRDGDNRSVIVFEIVPIDTFKDSNIDDGLAQIPLQDLRMSAIEHTLEEQPPRQSLQQAYYRSSAIKAYALARSGGSCEACGHEAPFVTSNGRPYLEVHHIKRISDGGPDHPE